MLPHDTKVIIKKVPSPMYESAIGKEAKAQNKVGEVSGDQQFVFDGAKALYLPEDHVEVV